jgi:phosphoribosylformimino-5-aminoimidazole carboxamide ribotide isomerase
MTPGRLQKFPLPAEALAGGRGLWHSDGFAFFDPRSGRKGGGVRVWPAIDLRGGKCVRLRQGDYQQETVFGDDPAAMARHWVGLGAECLHLVDLDGAKAGKPGNLESVRAILAAVSVPCEVGGGIRSEDTIRQLLDLGLKRLVIGTLALREPDWFRQMCRKFPGRLALGIDARDGRVASDGWLQTSSVEAVGLARQFAGEPIATLIYTDIAQDGMLTGPNVAAMAAMQATVDLPVVASGGVASADDVARLAEQSLAGCIVGRALYEGRLSLPAALAAAAAGQPRCEDTLP